MNLQAPPVKLSSLTYLSFHLERLVMHNTSDLHSPFIAISVHDSRGRKVYSVSHLVLTTI